MKQVTAAIIIENEKILLCRRSPTSKVGGAWELPGGKIEFGETPQECLERELIEELSMRGSAGSIVGESLFEYDHGSFHLIGVEFIRTGTFELNADIHDASGWYSKTEALALALAPADIPLIESIIF